MTRPLRLTWVEGRPSLAGGIKSNRLIAEAMARRGHQVTIMHLPVPHAWPPIWQVKRFGKRVRKAFQPWRRRHHLESSSVPVQQFSRRVLDPSEAPDADATIASWWQVWREVARWPASKGVKVHFARHHEIYAGARAEVDAAYAIPGPKVVTSTWLDEVMRSYGHTDIVRAPNGVDWAQFDSQPRARAARPTVGMLMSRAKFKDTPVGLRALCEVQRRMPDLRVIGFGQKPAPPEWEMPRGAEFEVQPSQARIPQIYQSCDCWVVPSASEGFAMPGLEGAASHCPLVCTRCGGPEDFVREGVNGSLVDVGDWKTMADRIEQILRLDDASWRTMSEASYAISRSFDWDRSADILERAVRRWIDTVPIRAAG